MQAKSCIEDQFSLIAGQLLTEGADLFWSIPMAIYAINEGGGAFVKIWRIDFCYLRECSKSHAYSAKS